MDSVREWIKECIANDGGHLANVIMKINILFVHTINFIGFVNKLNVFIALPIMQYKIHQNLLLHPINI